MAKKNSIGRLILFVVLGLLFGGILGECLGALLGALGEFMNAGGQDNIVKNFFIAAFNFNIGVDEPIVLDLYMIKIVLGFGLKLNFVSIIGLVVALYIMKWSGDR